jgi:hypothetical protein
VIPLTKLEPNCFYWATRRDDKNSKAQIVQVSTVFGAEREYWTVARVGSDEHRMPGDFEFIVRIVPPPPESPLIWLQSEPVEFREILTPRGCGRKLGLIYTFS